MNERLKPDFVAPAPRRLLVVCCKTAGATKSPYSATVSTISVPPTQVMVRNADYFQNRSPSRDISQEIGALLKSGAQSLLK
jgi:hypothetical protein